MGSRQCKMVSVANMAIGAAVLVVVGFTLLLGAASDSAAIFGFLAGAANLFYGYTVFRSMTDAEPDASTFYGLRKRAGSSWLVPALMTLAPLVGHKETCLPVIIACICATAAAALLDLCLRNGSKGN